MGPQGPQAAYPKHRRRLVNILTSPRSTTIADTVCDNPYFLSSTNCYMPHSLSKAHNHKESHKQKSAQSHKHLSEHGHAKRSNSDPLRGGFKLLELPAESLTHVTSFLDPSSLLSLSGANKRLHEHIEDDNTWRRAYVYQFLGVPPEGDIYESCSPDGLPGKAFMLRREESSWKREFVRRWNLRRYGVLTPAFPERLNRFQTLGEYPSDDD